MISMPITNKLLILRDKMIYHSVGGSSIAKNTLFIHIPKTGGTNFVKSKRSHLTIEEYARICPHYLLNNEIAAIYRKSEDRIFSLLNYMVMGGNKRSFGPFSDKKPSDDVSELLKIIQSGIKNYQNINEARNLLRSLSVTDRMFWPSSRFLVISGRMFATKIIDFNELQEFTPSVKNKADYLIENSMELKKLINDVYREDDEFVMRHLRGRGV